MNRIIARLRKQANNLEDMVNSDNVDNIIEITNVSSDVEEDSGSKRTWDYPGDPAYKVCNTEATITVSRANIESTFNTKVSDEDWNALVRALQTEAKGKYPSIFGFDFSEFLGEHQEKNFSGESKWDIGVKTDNSKISFDVLWENYCNDDDEEDEKAYWGEKKWEQDNDR